MTGDPGVLRGRCNGEVLKGGDGAGAGDARDDDVR